MSWMETTVRLIIAFALCIQAGICAVLAVCCAAAIFELGASIIIYCIIGNFILSNCFACAACDITKGVKLW